MSGLCWFSAPKNGADLPFIPYSDTKFGNLSQIDSTTQSALRDPDVRLMLDVRDGSAAAFESLLVRYQSRVLSILRHLIGNQDLAEDLTQEVFLRVYRARTHYKPGAKFSTWLFTIVNNVALNSIRGKMRRPEIQFGGSKGAASEREDQHSFTENDVQGTSSMNPIRRLEKMELREVVKHAIDSLGERQKMALLLHRFEGISYLEISEIMQLTPQAVKSLLCRARINLRDMLAPYIEQDKTTP